MNVVFPTGYVPEASVSLVLNGESFVTVKPSLHGSEMVGEGTVTNASQASNAASTAGGLAKGQPSSNTGGTMSFIQTSNWQSSVRLAASVIV